MAEVTRVPLRPIKQGSLAKLWLGVIVALALALVVAWAAMPKGVSVTEIEPGLGAAPQVGDVAFVKYVGKLPDGTVFDQSQEAPIPAGLFPEGNPFPVQEGATVQGFFEGLQQMKKGGKYELFIPADKGYGATPPPGSDIPANSDLVFEVEMIDFMSEEDFQRRIAMLQQMMQQQQGAAGAQGAPTGAPETAAPQQ